MDAKVSKGVSSAPFNQVLVFAHGRKTQSSLPGHFANTLTIQQKLSGESPTPRERNVVELFTHRPWRKWFGGYIALEFAILIHDFRHLSWRDPRPGFAWRLAIVLSVFLKQAQAIFR